MPKSPQQKARILHLQQILLQETDEEHGITLSQLIARLESRGIAAERKTLYDDLQTLELFGLDLLRTREKNQTYYRVMSRTFELPEVKLLIDAVESSKFITREKSSDLIQKMESLVSEHEAGQLNRHIFVANRVKTMNKGIYYTVDAIHDAINADCRISFQLTERVPDFNKAQKFQTRLRRDGKRYSVSPWELTWNDGNYYLVGFDAESRCIRHYRVDRMAQLTQLETSREGLDAFRIFDIGSYTKKVFNMFGGEEHRVQLCFANYLMDAVLERFGEDVYLRPASDTQFLIAADVLVSPQFFSWIFGFGESAKICGPESVIEGFLEWMDKTRATYAETAAQKTSFENG